MASISIKDLKLKISMSIISYYKNDNDSVNDAEKLKRSVINTVSDIEFYPYTEDFRIFMIDTIGIERACSLFGDIGEARRVIVETLFDEVFETNKEKYQFLVKQIHKKNK